MFLKTDSTQVAPDSEGQCLSRRGFLRMVGLAGGGLLLGSTGDAAARLFGPPRTQDVCAALDIPPAWVQQMGPALTEYAVFLSRLRLRHVSVAQIIQPHLKKRGSVQNAIPPKAMWRNIRSTLIVTDELCQYMQEPVTEILSAYRSPAYNARCAGGKSNSQHLYNRALDLRFRSSPRTVASAVRELRSKGLFQGGVGRYPGFTHVDTRGRNADW